MKKTDKTKCVDPTGHRVRIKGDTKLAGLRLAPVTKKINFRHPERLGGTFNVITNS